MVQQSKYGGNVQFVIMSGLLVLAKENQEEDVLFVIEKKPQNAGQGKKGLRFEASLFI